MSSEEKEIFSCHTGLAVEDSVFHVNQHMCTSDLLPAFHQRASIMFIASSPLVREMGIE